MRQGKRICILVPAYNEAANLPKLVDKLWAVTSNLRHNFELLFVDDGSSDSTWDVIEELASIDYRIRGISFSRNFGKESALISGIDNIDSEVDAVIILDADLQHPPNLIPQMVTAWETGHIKIVDAIKRSRGQESAINKFFSKVFYYLISQLGGFDLDNSSDFKLLDKVVIQELKKMREGNIFFRGMISWIGFSTLKLYFDVEPRADAKPGMSLKKRVQLAMTAISAFTSAPLQIVSVLSFCFFAFAILMTIQTVYQKMTGSAVTGFATVNILLLLIGSSVLFGLGIIGEYISRIYTEVKSRPRYIVSKSKNINKEDAKNYLEAANE